MKRVYICHREMELTKWLEVYADNKKDITALQKALKPLGWKSYGKGETYKTTLPDAYDDFDGDWDDLPEYHHLDINGPKGKGFFDWDANESRKFTRQMKKVLKEQGWEIWTWEKTFADMV